MSDAYVRTRGDRLVVTDGDESLLRLSLRRVRQVVCYGRIGLSTPFLQQAGQRGIEVVLLDQHGTAAGFIIGKVSNMRVTLLRTARRRDDLAAAEAVDRLEGTLDKLDQSPPLEEILGLEGSAARDYFQATRSLIGPQWGFETRQRRPPPDPVNA